MLNCMISDLSSLADIRSGETCLVRDRATWVALANRLLSEATILPENRLMRFQDFTREVLFRVDPMIQVLSPEVVDVFAERWLREFSEKKDVRSLTLVTKELAPVLLQESGYEVIRSWIATNSEIFDRWGWFAIAASEFMNWMIQNNRVSSDWVVPLLEKKLARGAFPGIWPTSVHVALGLEIKPVECHLLLELSRHVDVRVEVPETLIRSSSSSGKAYQMLLSRRVDNSEIKASVVAVSTASVQVYKLYSPLAEVKSLTALVRKELDSGRDPETIAVVCANPHEYFPAIRSYFEVEGLPLSFDEVYSLRSRTDVQVWLSRLQLACARPGDPLDSDQLRLAFYRLNSDIQLPRSDFERFYGKLYDVSDLELWPEIQNWRAQGVSDRSAVGPTLHLEEELEVFVSWALTFWPPEGDFRVCETLLNSLSQGIDLKLRFERRQWIELLDKCSLRGAHKIQDDGTRGIRLCSPNQIDIWRMKSLYFLGLTQKALQPTANALLSPVDQNFLMTQFGGLVGGGSGAVEPEDLMSALQNFQGALSLMAPSSDWVGEEQMASSLWSYFALQNPVKALPGWTRWDEIQSLPDAGESTQAKLSGLGVSSLSVSTLEKFAQCSFKGFAAKHLRLEPVKTRDLDLESSLRGQILHRVIERVMSFGVFEPWSVDGIVDLVNSAALELHGVNFDPALWKSQASRLALVLMRFFEAERTFRRQVPSIRTLANEARFEGFIDVETGDLLSKSHGKAQNQHLIPIRGVIDRLDVFQIPGSESNMVILWDYKSSTSGLVGAEKWLENRQLQLWFYKRAVELGLLPERTMHELSQFKILGSLYIDLKSLERGLGFLSDEGLALLGTAPFGSSTPKTLNASEISELDQNMKSLVQSLTQSFVDGEFEPKPLEVAICDSCEWRTLCRAPHLSL